MSTPLTEVNRPKRAALGIRLLPPLVGIALLLLALWALAGESLSLPQLGGGASTAPRVGADAPDFALVDLDGRTVRLSELQGKQVVLNFWATWCPPCRAEMPDLDRVAREYREQGVTVLAIDQMESPERVTSFLEEIGLRENPAFDSLLDTDGSVGQLYRVNALPSTFIVDDQGKIRDVHLGPISESTLRAKLERVR